MIGLTGVTGSIELTIRENIRTIRLVPKRAKLVIVRIISIASLIFRWYVNRLQKSRDLHLTLLAIYFEL